MKHFSFFAALVLLFAVTATAQDGPQYKQPEGGKVAGRKRIGSGR